MRVPIIVPDLHCNDEAIRLSGWLVDEGDLILAGDLVVEVLIPGITFDIVAESTGRLVEITKPIDAPISAGDILGWLDDTSLDCSETDQLDDLADGRTNESADD